MCRRTLLTICLGCHQKVAGDIRVNENVALTSMHTVWLREHNYHAEKLKLAHPDWDGDQIYNAARVIVEAEYQNVVFNEYLPLLLGADNIPDYDGYKSDVDPSISIEFSTAAYRLGHSQLSSTLHRMNADGSESDAGNLALAQTFFNPANLQTEQDLGSLIGGLSASPGQEIDTMIVDDVRNMLFGEHGPALDLASLNIMRGRDHGIGTLNEVRLALNMEAHDSFSDLTSNPAIALALEEVYGDIDNVELWIGGLADDKVPESQLGEVFHRIVLDQFMALRDGDRYFYEHRLADLPELLKEVNATSLSDIMLRNTDIDYLQDDVFVAHNRIGGT